jgi:hypothetical protein
VARRRSSRGVDFARALAGFGLRERAAAGACCSFLPACRRALVTRGWGIEGRFSLHLYGSASALCVWAAARCRTHTIGACKQEAA